MIISAVAFFAFVALVIFGPFFAAVLRELKEDSDNYRGECDTCDTRNMDMLTDTYCAVCEVNRLEAELADANYWRERHCKEGEAYGQQTVEYFDRIKQLEAELAAALAAPPWKATDTTEPRDNPLWMG